MNNFSTDVTTRAAVDNQPATQGDQQMAKAWAGQAVIKATRWVLNRDRGICWICGHPGADTCDHIKPRSTHPHLTWDPNNWAAAHGKARPELDCPGQFARGNYPGPRRTPKLEGKTNTTTKKQTKRRTW